MLSTLFLAVLAATPVVERDVAYRPDGGPRETLDVYALEGLEHRPVLVVVHGGGWQRGDKRSASKQAAAITTAHSAVVVAVEYRLVPEVDWKTQAGDVAAAAAWVLENIQDFGGDPAQVFLVGHSAGAHLAALVACDPSYLAAERRQPGDLAGVILLDSAAYDISKQLRAANPRARSIYETAFGVEVGGHQAASPIAHVGESPLPPFFIASVAGRGHSTRQGDALAHAIRSSGGSAQRLSVIGTHSTIYRKFGHSGDSVLPAATKALGIEF